VARRGGGAVHLVLRVQDEHDIQGARQAGVGAVPRRDAPGVQHEQKGLREGQLLVGRRRRAAGALVVRQRRQRRHLSGGRRWLLRRWRRRVERQPAAREETAGSLPQPPPSKALLHNSLSKTPSKPTKPCTRLAQQPDDLLILNRPRVVDAAAREGRVLLRVARRQRAQAGEQRAHGVGVVRQRRDRGLHGGGDGGVAGQRLLERRQLRRRGELAVDDQVGHLFAGGFAGV